MAIVKEFVTPGGCRVRIHDDELPKTPEELKRRQRAMYEVCAMILRNDAARRAKEQQGAQGS